MLVECGLCNRVAKLTRRLYAVIYIHNEIENFGITINLKRLK